MCDTPYYIKQKGRQIPVGCGRCPKCKKRRINQWVFRLQEEERHCLSSYFVTLTYKNSTLPKTLNKLPTLKHKDFQNFMKKLRRLEPILYYKAKVLKKYETHTNIKWVNKYPIRYYMSGEYGDKSFRPHYHAIIFQVNEIENIAKSWSRVNHKGENDVIGEIHIGEVNAKTIAYTAKYIDKPNRIPYHETDDRKPEYSAMSKGLGQTYVERMGDYHRGNINNNHVTMQGGYKVALPRFYKNKFFSEEEQTARRELIEQSLQQKEHQQRLKEIQHYKKLYKTDTFTFEDWRREKQKGSINSFIKNSTRDGI